MNDPKNQIYMAAFFSFAAVCVFFLSHLLFVFWVYSVNFIIIFPRSYIQRQSTHLYTIAHHLATHSDVQIRRFATVRAQNVLCAIWLFSLQMRSCRQQVVVNLNNAAIIAIGCHCWFSIQCWHAVILHVNRKVVFSSWIRREKHDFSDVTVQVSFLSIKCKCRVCSSA